MVDQTAAVVGVLVSVVVLVLALVVSGFWIYLCCGHKRDKASSPPKKSIPPRFSYIADEESHVSDAKSKTRFSQGDRMSMDDRGFFLSPIYTKPTVRNQKQKLFHSQPDLTFQKNVSHSIGDLMASEGQASQYQLSLDDFRGNEVELDEELFETKKQFEEPQSEEQAIKLDFDTKDESLQETTEATMTQIQPDSQKDETSTVSQTTSRGSQVSLQIEEDNETTAIQTALVNTGKQTSEPSINDCVNDDHSSNPEEPVVVTETLEDKEEEGEELEDKEKEGEELQNVEEEELKNEEEQLEENLTEEVETLEELENVEEEELKNEEEQLEEKMTEEVETLEEGNDGEKDLNHYISVLNTLAVPGLQDEKTGNESEPFTDFNTTPPGTSTNMIENDIKQEDRDEKEEVNEEDGSKSLEIKMADLEKLKENYDLIYPSVSDSTLPESVTSLREDDPLKSSSSSESETKLLTPPISFRKLSTKSQELNSTTPIQQETTSTDNNEGIKEDVKEELIETTSLSCVAELTEKFQQNIASSPSPTPDSPRNKPLKYSVQKALRSGIDTSGSESSLGSRDEYLGPPLVRRYNDTDGNTPNGKFGTNEKREQQEITDIHASDSDTKTSSEEEMLTASKPNLDLSETEPKSSIGVSPLVVSYKAENGNLPNVSSLTDTDTGDESDELMQSSASKPVKKQAIIAVQSTSNKSFTIASNERREKEESVNESFSDSENDLSESDGKPSYSPPRMRKITPHPDTMGLSDHARYKLMHQTDTTADNAARTSLKSIPEEDST